MWIEQAAKELGAKTKWLPFELHADTPNEGAPKPFTDEQWPAIRERLISIAAKVGLPMNPPRRNVNSRLALETGELVRLQFGDDQMAAFHHAVSRAFFVDGADIGALPVIVELAKPFGLTREAVAWPWSQRQFASTIEESMRASRRAGVTGVPAFGWPDARASSGMMEPEAIVAILRERMPK